MGRDEGKDPAGREGEDVLARWLAHRAPAQESDEPAEEPPGPVAETHHGGPTGESPPATSRAAVTPPTPAEEPPDPVTEDRDERPAGTPLRTEFAPRRGVRRVVTLVGLLAAAGAAAAAYVAWQERTAPAIGIAATLAGLSVVIWAVQATSPPTRLRVERGVLEVARGGTSHSFDLASRYLDVEMVGEPGTRGWKVLLHRRGAEPLVIDRSVVDPHDFAEVLWHYRPGLGTREEG